MAVADVELARQHRAGEHPGGLLESVAVLVGEGDGTSMGGEALGDGATDPGRGAGDDGGAAADWNLDLVAGHAGKYNATVTNLL